MKTEQQTAASLLEQSRRLAADGDMEQAARVAHRVLEALDAGDVDGIAEVFTWLDEIEQRKSVQQARATTTQDESTEQAMLSGDEGGEKPHGDSASDAVSNDIAVKTCADVDASQDCVAEAQSPAAQTDAELLESIRAYRKERDTGASEQDQASGEQQAKGVAGDDTVTTDAHDFEDDEREDDEQSRSALERALQSGYTMLGAAALAVLIVVVTIWALFFAGSDDAKGVARTSSTQGGWPDIPYDEARRGHVSHDEASSALRRAAVQRQRERKASSEQTPSTTAAGVELELAQQPMLARAPDDNKTGQGRPPADGRKRVTSKRPRSASKRARSVPAEEAKPRKRGRWFFGSGLESEPEKKAPAKSNRAPIAIGSRLKARLDVGVSSLSHGQVMALLVEPFSSGEFVLPKGALLIGRSRNRGARVFLDFEKVIDGGKTWSLKGVAIANDMMKGIAARSRTVTLEERQQSEIAQGVLGALRRGVAAAAGSAGRVADEVVGGAIEETRDDQRVEEGVVYEVGAGEEFTVLVTE